MSPTINTASSQLKQPGDNPLYYKVGSGRRRSDSDVSLGSESTFSVGSSYYNDDVVGHGLPTIAKQRNDAGSVSSSQKGGRRGTQGEHASEENYLREGHAKLAPFPHADRGRGWNKEARRKSDTSEPDNTALAALDDNINNKISPLEFLSRRKVKKHSAPLPTLQPLDINRPAFPASVTLSRPTSTTVLDYLLYEHQTFPSPVHAAISANDKLPLLTQTTNESADKESGALGTTSLIQRRPSLPNATPTANNLKKARSVFSTPTVSQLSGETGIGNYLSKYYSSEDQSICHKKSYDPEDLTMTRSTSGLPASGISSGSLTQQQQNKLEDYQGSSVSRKSSERRHVHDSKSVAFQFFQVEPCIYTHRMISRAARIFEVLKSDDTDTIEARTIRRRQGNAGQEGKQKIPDMEFLDAHEQIKTFELTFAALKYQELFRDILERTGFFSEFTNLRSDYSLVFIILYDLQSRKFQKRVPLPEEYEHGHSPSSTYTNDDGSQKTPNGDATNHTQPAAEDASITNTLNTSDTEPLDPSVLLDPATFTSPQPVLDPVCLEVETALLSRKTKLQSHLAKERIKRNAPTLEHLLPEQVRNKDETKSSTPVYCWVNQLKATLESTIESLRQAGFEELPGDLDISQQTTSVFRRDPHCSDLLVFPPHLNMYFKDSAWVKSGEMVQQDKSSCLAPQTVQLLLGLDQDVLHVNMGTGMSTAHLASLLKTCSPHSQIYALGSGDPDKCKKVAKNLENLGAKTARVINDEFLSVDPDDSRWKSVRVIMITADCSKSAITSPVQFIVSEGEDMQILGELSQADSNMARVEQLALQHQLLLRHALKFPRVRAVVYTTRSRYQAENEQVVTQALEAVNNMGHVNSRRVPFRVTPPVLPFSGSEVGGEAGREHTPLVDGRFASFRPTDKANGCFVAIIAREPEDPKEVARSAVARARSRGMLGKGDTQQTDGDSKAAAGSSSAPAGRRRGGKSKKSGDSDAKSGLRSRSSNHRSPAATAGARLYQAGIVSRLEQARLRAHRPEHVGVVKHPAPFSNKPKALQV